MSLARTVATRSSCSRRQVGALLVHERRVISTGYNGTPTGVLNCDEGGCERCASSAPPGSGYDTCICVHAEQNTLLLAARHGIRTDGATLYTTLRPCFGCLKEAIQAGVPEIVSAAWWEYEGELEWQYQRLVHGSRMQMSVLPEA